MARGYREQMASGIESKGYRMKVKQLEWVYNEGANEWRAETDFGDYVVGRFKAAWIFGNTQGGWYGHRNPVSEDAAKASAQADFERRVMACMEVEG